MVDARLAELARNGDRRATSFGQPVGVKLGCADCQQAVEDQRVGGLQW
jgi:hypothetical protein